MLAELLLAAAVTQPVTAEFCRLDSAEMRTMIKLGIEAGKTPSGSCDFVNNSQRPVLTFTYTVELREPGRRVPWIKAHGSSIVSETIPPNGAVNRSIFFFDEVVGTPTPLDLSSLEVILNVTSVRFAD